MGHPLALLPIISNSIKFERKNNNHAHTSGTCTCICPTRNARLFGSTCCRNDLAYVNAILQLSFITSPNLPVNVKLPVAALDLSSFDETSNASIGLTKRDSIKSTLPPK